MGEGWVDVRVALPQHPETSTPVNMLADTGATLSVLPRSLLEKLGVRPQKRIPVVESDGRRVEREVGEVMFGVNGDRLTARVIFGEPGDAVVLGLTVLEAMGWVVDPVQQRLIPSPLRK